MWMWREIPEFYVYILEWKGLEWSLGDVDLCGWVYTPLGGDVDIAAKGLVDLIQYIVEILTYDF